VRQLYGWLYFKLRLRRDFENSIESSEALLQLAFIDMSLKEQPIKFQIKNF
jgi:hypothetical protein